MFRAFVNPEGTVTSESMPPDYEAQPGEVLFPDPPTEADLAPHFGAVLLAAEKARARAIVSRAAEAARLQFVTAGSAKAMAYQEKAKEAVDFLADAEAGAPGHDAALYPLIYSEVGITAADPAAVAQVIAGRYQAFKLIEAQIGAAEAGAQKAVKDAADVATIAAVLNELAWPTPTQE